MGMADGGERWEVLLGKLCSNRRSVLAEVLAGYPSTFLALSALPGLNPPIAPCRTGRVGREEA